MIYLLILIIKLLQKKFNVNFIISGYALFCPQTYCFPNLMKTICSASLISILI